MTDLTTSWRILARMFAMGGGLTIGVSSAWAASVQEFESNDDFVLRQVLAPDVRTVMAELGDGDRLLDVRTPDIIFSGSLFSGQVRPHTSTGLDPGTSYVAIIDNTPFGGSFGPDTMLGSFTEFGEMVAFGDDDSPLGDGFASALVDVVNDDGSVRLRITGFNDFNFDGFDDDLGFPHFEEGSYQLFVYLGEVDVDDLQRDLGDVDQFTFTGLTPGATFSARISQSDIDSTLFWLADQGEIIEVDDDDAGGVLSLIEGTVPENGRVNLAVSGFPDFDLRRDHPEFGEYLLTIEELTALVLGDMNGDGVLDAFDVAPFELALADAAAYAATYPNLDPDELGDFDENGSLNAFDVAGFEGALAGAENAAAIPQPASAWLALAGLGALLRRAGRR